MAYIGNLPATGQNNSFRLLDDITSYTLTFDGSSASIVNSSDKTIESANHRFIQGQRVVYGAGGGTPVANLTGGTAYFIIKQGGSHFQLATSATNASNGVAISISAAGSATGHTLIASFDAVNTRFMASHSGGTKVNITRSAQLNISINGVIQEPQETASPTAGFGRDSGSVIVFSTAPNAGDAFWGSLVADNVPTFDISDNDVDNFTGDDSTTDFTLSKTPPDNRNILVTLDGVTQHPSDNTTTRAYNVTENILSFTSAPNTSVSIQVRHIGFAGATTGSGGVSAFYGRTGSVVLKNTDTINVANIVDEGYLAVGSTASFGGDVSIGGTLTYDDVTYVESVGIITANKGVEIPNDTFKYRAGDQLEMQVFHDGTDSIFKDTRDTGSIKIQADNFAVIDKDDSQTMIVAGVDGSVSLRHSGNEKFKTIGYGVTVVGAMQVSGMTTIFDQTTISTDDSQSLLLNHPATNGQSSIAFQSGGSTKWIVGSNKDSQADQDFFIFDNSNSKHRFNIKADGNIGIGSDNPGQDLHIYNSGYAGQIFQSQRTDYYDNIGGPLFHDHTGAVKAKVQSNVGGDLKFNSGGTDNRMVLVSSGQLGIGITNPEDYQSSSNDFVFGKTSNTGGMTIRSGTGNGGYIRFADGTSGNQAYRGTIAYLHDGDFMQFAVDSEERLRITGAGITVTGEVAATQDYPNFQPTLDLNFAAEKKLDPRITYQRSGPASFTDEFGKVVLVGDNVPRFDHDPVTRESKGLLIEESRTNLFASSDPSNSVWILDGSMTRTANTTDTKDPAGTYTATKLMSAASANSTSQIYDGLSHGSGGVQSLWAKKGTHNVLGIFDYGGGSGVRGWFDLNTGEHRCEGGTKVAAGVQSGGNDTNNTNMIEYPNGWYRCIYYEAANMTYAHFRIVDFDADNEASASSNSIYVWGLQAEGSGVLFATSHIPCNTGVMPGTITRGADLTEITEEEFSEFYNQTEGSIVSEIMLPSVYPISGKASVMTVFSDGSYNNRINLASSTGSAVFNADINIGGTLTRAALGSYTAGSHSIKAAMAYKAADTAGSLNGAAAGTSSPSGTLPLLTRADIGKDHINNNPLNGHIKRLMYYSKRLPNSQLVTLTS